MFGPIDFSRLEVALATRDGWLDLAIVALCIGVAWVIDRRLEARARAAEAGSRRRLHAGMGRVVFSLLALLLLAFGRAAYRFAGGTPLFIDIAIPLLIALAVIRMLLYGMRQLFAEQKWLKTSERAIAFSIWALVALYFVGALPEIARELDELKLPIGKSVSLLTIVKGVAAVVVTLVITLWLSGLLERGLLSRTNVDTNTKALLAKLIRALLLVVGIMIALNAIGFDLTLLSVFGGALGVGIGLGLQKLAANYIAGFTILLERAIRLGDMITVDGRQGRVARVTSRYVVVRSLDGTEAIVPNETLVTTTVVNHSNAAHDIRVSIPIQIAHESDVDVALRLMEEAARGDRRLVPGADPPTAFLMAFTDSGVSLDLVLWVVGPPAGMQNFRSDLYRRILAAFGSHGIAIPFPRRDIRAIANEPAPVPPA